MRYTNIELIGPDGLASPMIQSGDALTLRLHFRANERILRPGFGVRFYTSMGTLITDTSTWLHGVTIAAIEPGDGHVDLELDALNLVPGRYMISLTIGGGAKEKLLDGDVQTFLDVEPSGAYGTVRVLNSRYGIVYFGQRWNVSGVAAAKTHLESV